MNLDFYDRFLTQWNPYHEIGRWEQYTWECSGMWVKVMRSQIWRESLLIVKASQPFAQWLYCTDAWVHELLEPSEAIRLWGLWSGRLDVCVCVKVGRKVWMSFGYGMRWLKGGGERRAEELSEWKTALYFKNTLLYTVLYRPVSFHAFDYKSTLDFTASWLLLYP